jgi:F1F0 ATPase subunit 2
MNECLSIVWTIGAGLLLGAFFYGGLWWTVQKLSVCRRPALLLISSLIIRSGVILSAFYLIVEGGYWGRLLVSLLGFVVARLLVTKLIPIPIVLTASSVKVFDDGP